MGTKGNCIFDNINTKVIPGKDSKYESATAFTSSSHPNTSVVSSSFTTVTSSKTHGVISIRTIPTSVPQTVLDKLTT